MATLSAQDVHSMVRHWLATPVNAYLGSGYGSDLKALLQTPQAAGLADDVIRKLREDVPLLGQMPAGAIGLYAIPAPPDRLDLYIEVSGSFVPIGEGA